MKDLILFGIQGAGKGTQAALLLENMPDTYAYFSSGDLFRALQSSDNAIGNYVKHRIQEGLLIDDKVTNALFTSYLYTVIDDEKQMMLDGFPRTIPQMENMFTLLEEHGREIQGIQFVLPDEGAIERMKGRGRKDDNDEAIALRMQQFYDKTQPVIDRFADHAELVQIDANRTVEEIATDVVQFVQV